MALSKDRNTPQRIDAKDRAFDVAASTKCIAGGIAVLDASGNAAPGSTATGLVVVGRFEETVDNGSGSAGDRITLEIDPRTHPAWTGQHRLVDSGGQVAKFNKRFKDLGLG